VVTKATASKNTEQKALVFVDNTINWLEVTVLATGLESNSTASLGTNSNSEQSSFYKKEAQSTGSNSNSRSMRIAKRHCL